MKERLIKVELAAAAKADQAHNRKIKAANGQNSYIPTEILKNGQRLDDDEYDELQQLLACPGSVT